MISGVAGGIAAHISRDPKLIRVLWVILAWFTVGLAVVLYLVLWGTTPEEE